MSDDYRRVEIITGTPRQPRWTAEQKLCVVEESHQSGDSVSAVAGRRGVAANLQKVQGEWDLVCLALNIKRMQGLQAARRPEFSPAMDFIVSRLAGVNSISLGPLTESLCEAARLCNAALPTIA